MRRILAWLVDWLWILLGLAGLLVVSLLLRSWEWELSAVGWNILTFFVTVVPVTLWLAWREAAPRGATPGKRRLGLQVVDAGDGTLVPFGRSLVRNLAKVAVPWELGHTVAFGFATLEAGVPGWLTALTVLIYALMIWYVASLFIGSGVTPYDRLARTRVVAGSTGPAGQ